MRARPVLLPLGAFLCVALAGAVHAAPAYTFSLAGEPFNARILPVQGERLGKPGPGDVGFLHEIPFVLRQPGHYRFQAGDSEGTVVTCRINDDPVIIATASIGQESKRPVDSLSLFLPSDFASLMGIEILAPTDQWEGPVSRIDWTHTALRIVAAADTTDLPAIHRDTRYLSIDASASTQLRDLSALKHLHQLLYLELILPKQGRFSLAGLAGLPNLCNLNIKGGTLTDLDKVADHGALRFLKLRSLRGLDSVAFARTLPSLRVLKVDETDVTDLRPLAGLKDLRLLSANATKVASLPSLESLPALRDLRLHSTPVARQKNVIAPLRPQVNVLIKNWDPSIAAFEAQDRKSPPPEKPILFLGSSSTRMWDLKKSFPGLPTLNRGFGGSELSDSLRYFDRIVLPYRPRAILLYAGDNDISNGESAGQVVADYKSFAARVRSHLPQTHFAFLPIKPSLKRWALWPEMNKANQAIRKLSEADPCLHYLDTATPMLGGDGKPIPALFLDDGLHMNEDGYTIWNDVVRPWLAEH